jgi:hypothetical protein
MTEKIISGININTRDISSEGETRQLNITGDEGAIFSIEIPLCKIICGRIKRLVTSR